MIHKVIQGDCETELEKLKDFEFFKGIHLTFLDPPFNQNKDYNSHDDNMPEKEYWNWMKIVVKEIYNITVNGGAIYFMQREKNTEYVLRTLRETGWTFQNLIAWNKLTSAIPSKIRFNKKYQIIAYFTKGSKPLTFNNLRYEPPLLASYENERETGMYLTDIWDNLRELTSGYLAGREAIRTQKGEYFTKEGERFHKQQSPIELLTRIILSSSKAGDFVLDPFAGTGVTAIVAKQLKRNSISIELDPINVKVINKRLEMMREDDDVSRFYGKYIYSENLDTIWCGENNSDASKIENYYFKEIPKNKLNNLLLMKETVKNVLINRINLPENLIKLDYRLKDKNNKIHRFELVVHVKPYTNLIFRLIYAKSQDQADFWIKRIVYEYNMIKQKEPKSYYYAVISGIAFNKIIGTISTEIPLDNIIPFPGWEKTYDLPNIIKIIKSQDVLKNIKLEKQISLDNF